MSDSTPPEKNLDTPFDLYLVRPAADLCVKVALPTPLSATAVAVLAVLLGLGGASAFRFITPANLVVGAVVMLLHTIFDRAAGQLALARDTPLPFGRMGDYIVAAACGITISLQLYASQGASGAWLGLGGLGSVVLQEALSNHFKSRTLARPTPAGPAELDLIARVWVYLGPSTHIALMSVFACAGQLGLYAWLRLTMGNMLVAALYLGQRWLEREPGASG